jgi:hypothetical protein
MRTTVAEQTSCTSGRNTMTTTTIPLPAGALEASSFEECSGPDGNSRVVGTPMRCVAGREDATVRGYAIQLRDGSIDTEGDEPPHVWVECSGSRGLTTDEARELAALIVRVADQIDGWAER